MRPNQLRHPSIKTKEVVVKVLLTLRKGTVG